MNTPIRVAVIGAGMAGQAHAFGFRNAMMAVSSKLSVELDTIADPNLPLAESVAARYGFKQATGDIDALLERDDIDAISVALPNFLHAEVLPKVLASGKHVFAEKPIGRTVEESSSLQALAEKTDAVTGVGFSFRRLPGLAALAQAIADGRLGDVHTVRGWYYADYAADPAGALSWRYSQEQSGGGALLDIGSHAIDAVQFVAGQITGVANATLKTVISERPKPAAGAIGHGASTSTETGPVTNDDIALLSVEFASGAVGQIELSRIAQGVPNALGVEVFGTEGHAAFDSIAAGEFSIFETGLTDSAYNGPRRVFTGPEHPYFKDVAAMPGGGVGTGYAEAFTAEIQEFVRCIQEGAEMDTDFAEATAMMRVVGAALESSKTGQAVAIEHAREAATV
ncbi:Gfo/Idh/MocA family protein [Gulosibacter chungangensis]|uniref:Gfo/Idh/MocA family oxidoreductase n=1 Tax=Gulosibacter chungangensis TaxID=979746 RepID=A0A7J5BHI3_9MICO|nr:Gfo/Idh/MocA family oxidoreductase [Gulosibacter chungangensis]KAB1645080.1 Gfo/Idh/MocA family oxidoreductase [Gulosibacter chungangensis]